MIFSWVCAAAVLFPCKYWIHLLCNRANTVLHLSTTTMWNFNISQCFLLAIYFFIVFRLYLLFLVFINTSHIFLTYNYVVLIKLDKGMIHKLLLRQNKLFSFNKHYFITLIKHTNTREEDRKWCQRLKRHWVNKLKLFDFIRSFLHLSCLFKSCDLQ